MAVRNESVRLSLEDNFTTGMARAAAATAVLSKELRGLDGQKVGRDLDRSSKGVDNFGSSTRTAGSDIDKFSGRLSVLADAALLLGPALIPLGAATLPALSAGLAGVTAAAGGIGVAALALNGLGDGIKALDAYNLDPTIANFDKLKEAEQSLGPAGTEFLHYIDSLEPALKDLQNVARGGFLPGLEEGIDSLLTRLPEVRSIVESISDELGNLSRDAGASLASDDFSSFFNYLRTDAAPTLDSFARSAGNVGVGLANLLVAFAPASRDFTGGLEDVTSRFADFSKTLDTNEGFQHFLAYVRQSGPQAVHLLAGVADALGGLAHAAAPVGSALLPTLTAMARVFAVIANSPLGPVLYGTVAAMTAFNRVASLGASAAGKFSGAVERAQTPLGRLALTAGGVVAVGTAVGALADNINRIDPSKLDAGITALSRGDTTEQIQKVIDSIQQLDSPANKVDLGEIVTAGGLFGDSSLDKFANNIDLVDQKLANLVATGQQTQAADIFGQFTKAAEAEGVSAAEASKHFDDYALALKNVAPPTAGAEGLASLLGQTIGQTGESLSQAANAAEDLSGALSHLNGFFSKRDAVLSYKDSVDQLAKGLKDGFTREDAQNLNAVGQSILQVADSIKNPGKRATFLDNARDTLADVAAHTGPKASAAIQGVLDKFNDSGLTHPKPIELTADDRRARNTITGAKKQLSDFGKSKASATLDGNDSPFDLVYNTTKKNLATLDGATATPHVGVDAGNSLGLLGSIKSAVDRLQDKTIHVTTVNLTQFKSTGNPQARTEATGGHILGPGTATSDSIPAYLSNGEYVIRAAAVQKYGVHMFDRLNAQHFASGGSVDSRTRLTVGNLDLSKRLEQLLGKALRSHPGIEDRYADNLIKGLNALDKTLNRQVKEQGRALTKLTDKLDAASASLSGLQSARSDLSSSVAGNFQKDPFGNGLAGLNLQLRADTNDANSFQAVLANLVAQGLDSQGAFFKAIAQSGDLNTASQLNSAGAGTILADQNLYNTRSQVTSGLGDYAAGQQYDKAIAEATKVNTELTKQVREQQRTNRELTRELTAVAAAVEAGADRGSERGTRRGQDDKNRGTAADSRTGSGSSGGGHRRRR